jgi:hypothetical protein
MSFLSPNELDMYRPRFLCSLNRLARGLSENSICSDDVYNDIGIRAYEGAERSVADSLVQDAVESGFVNRGTGREISLTVGVKWCRERCK